ncbi:MAG: hypothetical protein B7Z15_10540 [Rhizobiales bacterium 32-66-8]|nr:MAG: hypothetical protein B7Z15_10540 [Rhizobiales bacterium 32-66-8]
MAAFQGKSVLVLGGSRGIGAAIVRRFAAEGAAVTFTYAGSRDAAERLAIDTGSTAVMTDSADRDAVIALVRDCGPLDVLGLARDFGPRGITINIVQPGPIDTDANPEDGPMKELMHSFMAIKRHGRPEEVAGMVAWLAGAEAGFVTGAMHTIDGAFGA